MKRFVTYLYLYDGRIKGNNAGFIKVEINGEKSAFLVQIKNLGKYSGKGKVYLVYEAEAAIEAGELTVKNGEAREIYNVDTENVKDSGKTFLQVLGVKIELENADEKFLAALLAAIEAEGRKMGITNLISIITDENAASCRFHEKNGFVKEGHLHDIAVKFGRRCGVCYYRKELG